MNVNSIDTVKTTVAGLTGSGSVKMGCALLASASVVGQVDRHIIDHCSEIFGARPELHLSYVAIRAIRAEIRERAYRGK